MNQTQLTHLISETLSEIGYYDEEYVNLLLCTVAQESLMGHYIHQVKGPAEGIFQMEPATFANHLTWLKKNKIDLYIRIFEAAKCYPTADATVMRFNIKLSISMAMVHYLRRIRKEPLKTKEEIWHVYKKYYNTYEGSATEAQFMKHTKSIKI